MATSENFELKLGFGEKRLSDMFAAYDPKSTGRKSAALAEYALQTRERKQWLDGLKEKTLVGREDYFSRVKDAFENLTNSLTTLRAGLNKGQGLYDIEGLARKHFVALEGLIELHKKGITVTAVRGIHTESHIDGALTRIKDQVDGANQIFAGWFWRFSKKH